MSNQLPTNDSAQLTRSSLSQEPDLVRRREEARAALALLLRSGRKAPYTVLRIYDPHDHTVAQVFTTPTGLIYYSQVADLSVNFVEGHVDRDRTFYRMRQTRPQPYVDLLAAPTSLAETPDRVPGDCGKCRVQIVDPHLRVDLLLREAATALERMPSRRKVRAIDVTSLGADAQRLG